MSISCTPAYGEFRLPVPRSVAPSALVKRSEHDLWRGHPRGRHTGLDRRAGELPKALVVPAGAELDPGGIIQFVAEQVAPYKRIRAVEIVDEIPKSPSGRILRRLLEERERADRD